MNLAFTIEYDYILLGPKVVLQMLAHESVRHEDEAVSWKPLANSEIVAAGYTDIALRLYLGTGVDVADHR